MAWMNNVAGVAMVVIFFAVTSVTMPSVKHALEETLVVESFLHC